MMMKEVDAVLCNGTPSVSFRCPFVVDWGRYSSENPAMGYLIRCVKRINSIFLRALSIQFAITKAKAKGNGME